MLPRRAPGNSDSVGLGFPDESSVVEKVLLPMQEMQVQSLRRKDSLEWEMATHSSILAWRIPQKRSLAGYSPQDHKESDVTVVT